MSASSSGGTLKGRLNQARSQIGIYPPLVVSAGQDLCNSSHTGLRRQTVAASYVRPSVVTNGAWALETVENARSIASRPFSGRPGRPGMPCRNACVFPSADRTIRQAPERAKIDIGSRRWIGSPSSISGPPPLATALRLTALPDLIAAPIFGIIRARIGEIGERLARSERFAESSIH